MTEDEHEQFRVSAEAEAQTYKQLLKLWTH